MALARKLSGRNNRSTPMAVSYPSGTLAGAKTLRMEAGARRSAAGKASVRQNSSPITGSAASL